MNNLAYRIDPYFPMIEADVPMPGVKQRKKDTVWKQLADEMKVGNSVLLRNKKEADCLYAAFYEKGMRSSQRKVKGGVRVWRVK